MIGFARFQAIPAGRDITELASFTPFPGYTGGVSVSLMDADGDGQLDLGVGSLGTGSIFLAFHYPGLDSFDSYGIFDSGYTGGINVA